MIKSHTLVLAGRVLKLKYPEWLGIYGWPFGHLLRILTVAGYVRCPD